MELPVEFLHRVRFRSPEGTAEPGFQILAYKAKE